MYVWHELRNACPLEQSPSNSDGNAGGGGHPVGADRTGIMSIGDTFVGVGGVVVLTGFFLTLGSHLVVI